MPKSGPSTRKVVFISSITSDIGLDLAKRYSSDGYVVAGTYRSKKLLPQLKSLPDCHLFYCDLKNKASLNKSIKDFARLKLPWETFISAAVWPPPLNGFFESDFDEWSASVHVNAIEQLRVLHGLYPLRRKGITANAVFFAGPGTNNAVKNFSALAVSKIMLIKMCELLDAETSDLNVFIVGPGWTKTKTHWQILADPHVSKEKYEETMRFMQSGQGTKMEDIYRCIRWLSRKGRRVSGGRNFSVVHDRWGKEDLAKALLKDIDMYKLRRFQNGWKPKGDRRS